MATVKSALLSLIDRLLKYFGYEVLPERPDLADEALSAARRARRPATTGP